MEKILIPLEEGAYRAREEKSRVQAFLTYF